MLYKNKYTRQRAILISVFIFLGALGVYLLLWVFSNNIFLYTTPSEIISTNQIGSAVRLGGKVQNGSISYMVDSKITTFVIYDNKQQIKVTYKGIIPSLFKEGQEVVVYGKLGENHVFEAKELLAKHDENYIPKTKNEVR
ncbi:cytochrome c maturation protein CcmE [Candidatus Bandiella euplotis]|uniref:Cytochrome c-type biogenesis protein CcmE n=1 Tax=Candidatus Bandiella euplotis TaxID=1664265 RepID=A0ABZ0UQB4_9RICK|nr:cytochrome c maturation protein CcmE [Candidatus Bandiella woodruffii]WPX96898.1 Cytochrome c-type biogenesis protein CcmE [Candidatus Bandiella woodruffii]